MAVQRKQPERQAVSPKRESGVIIAKNDNVALLVVDQTAEGSEKGVREKDIPAPTRVIYIAPSSRLKISPQTLASRTSLLGPPPDSQDGQTLSLDALLAHIDSLEEHFGTLSIKRSPSDSTDYGKDDLLYRKEREKVSLVDKYLERQGELSAESQAQLVDWIVRDQRKLYLFHEVLYLAVKIIDRYLSVEHYPRATVRLLSAAATSIAAKYDDKAAPSVAQFLSICEEAYHPKKLVTMQTKGFQTLKGEISAPLSYHYLNP